MDCFYLRIVCISTMLCGHLFIFTQFSDKKYLFPQKLEPPVNYGGLLKVQMQLLKNFSLNEYLMGVVESVGLPATFMVNPRFKNGPWQPPPPHPPTSTPSKKILVPPTLFYVYELGSVWDEFLTTERILKPQTWRCPASHPRSLTG